MVAAADTAGKRKVSKTALIAVVGTIVAVILIAAVIAIAVVVVNTNANVKKHDMLASTQQVKRDYLVPSVRIMDEKVPKYMTRRKVADKPAIDLFEGFISPADAKYVIALAGDRFRPSAIMEKSDAAVSGKQRSSTSVFLTSESDVADAVLQRIRKLAAHVTGIPLAYMEPLQVVRYEKGQFYKPHYDYLNEKSAEVHRYGQRTATVLVYLNTIAEEHGGGTKFHAVDHAVQPVAGNALVWFNVTPAGVGDSRTLHSGEPITGEGIIKYAVNIWFRDRPQ